MHVAGQSYGAGLAADGVWLAEASHRPDEGVLRTYTVPGTMLLLGRYHLVSQEVVAGPVSVQRRRTGGRVVPFGDGFFGLSLILPHRAALVGNDWRVLEPAQVINRCVRGVLRGLRALGVAAFYPGRDLITVDRRIIGMVSFETTTAGALLFESMLAVDRGFAIVPALLDTADPRGVIKAAMITPEEVTTVSEAAGRAVSGAELTERIAEGYADAFQLKVTPVAGGAERETGPGTVAADRDGATWVLSRAPRAEFDHRGTVATQLGMLEALVARRGDRLGPLMFTGDFIANAAAVELLEARLVGERAEWGAISALAFEEFAAGENFILGLGSVSVLADVIMRALGRGSGCG